MKPPGLSHLARKNQKQIRELIEIIKDIGPAMIILDGNLCPDKV
jgi:hypothetical protein